MYILGVVRLTRDDDIVIIMVNQKGRGIRMYYLSQDGLYVAYSRYLF